MSRHQVTVVVEPDAPGPITTQLGYVLLRLLVDGKLPYGKTQDELANAGIKITRIRAVK